ncbi:class D sortase [Alteromonas aestuariivivens]|uniref:Class D sortase n=1 Tax=Alteromonas aestuariivivens TaxID=1938339 RepID=A0A3D8M444_9ALTE|nr:class D sortase [Alteromonas aestuariivivens]RDV24513.1 class D sortase [Alteromonas aestuariivivens]
MIRPKFSAVSEALLVIFGLMLVGHFFYKSVLNASAAGVAVSEFRQSSAALSKPSLVQGLSAIPASALTAIKTPAPDQSLWSQSAKDKFAKLPQGEDPIAVISVPSLSLDVPVYAGASDDNLDRGAAWVEYTADPRETGNVGIAGHRDSWFRPLKDIQLGDQLILQTLERTENFVVTDIQVVTPQNTDVLRDSGDKTITLITCFPFYFIGSAPERFVVSAKLID